jgi:CRISPR-associated endonuclease/helicase Cas3
MLLLTFSAPFKHANITPLTLDEPLLASSRLGRDRPLYPARKEVLVMGRARGYKRFGKVGSRLGHEVNYYAHTAVRSDGTPERDTANWQLLSTHLRNVADLAQRFAEPLGLAAEAWLAGLLHDLGKFRAEFQQYLRNERKAGSDTHHAIYGAALAWARALALQDALPQAFAIAGHHAGLPNANDLKRILESGRYPAKEQAPKLAALLERELEMLRWNSSDLIQRAVQGANDQDALTLEFATRMVFSALVDADRLDSANWPQQAAADDELTPQKSGDLLAKVLAERERKRQSKPTGEKDAELRRLRNDVFDACLEAAKLDPGFFSLTVPTGGGKTLSAMAFALAHAEAHGLRRVIVVIPFLSIIEQNATVYREVLGDDTILEHHSAAPEPGDMDEEEKAALETATENWDAPIVVTTSVQFLESLFADKPAKCRKLHRIAKSVVIFDEVQTLPTHLLAPVLNVFRELQRNYGVSLVFSSATQPAFRKTAHLPDGFTPEEMREIAPEPPKLFQALRRVDYHFPKAEQTLDWPELAQQLASERQALCVVNLRRHAATLWEQVRGVLSEAREQERLALFHLSSSMCAQHRLDVLGRVRQLLAAGCPCRVVSTQLIEAGVDVDFPVVWRAMGPLDSIVQVAGRCNREGRLPDGQFGQVHVFTSTDNGLPRGRLYQTATGFAGTILADITPQELATNPALFTRYFGMIHALPQPEGVAIQEHRRELLFRTVGREAKVIDDDTRPVIVEYGEGARLVTEIQTRQRAANQPRFDKTDLRHLQRFMVNVRLRDFQVLQGQRHLQPLLPNLDLHVLKSGHYHPELGLLLEQRPLEDFLQ